MASTARFPLSTSCLEQFVFNLPVRLLKAGAPAVSLREDSLRAPDCPGGDSPHGSPRPILQESSGKSSEGEASAGCGRRLPGGGSPPNGRGPPREQSRTRPREQRMMGGPAMRPPPPRTVRRLTPYAARGGRERGFRQFGRRPPYRLCSTLLCVTTHRRGLGAVPNAAPARVGRLRRAPPGDSRGAQSAHRGKRMDSPTSCSTGQLHWPPTPSRPGALSTSDFENWTERESRDPWDGKLRQQLVATLRGRPRLNYLGSQLRPRTRHPWFPALT